MHQYSEHDSGGQNERETPALYLSLPFSRSLSHSLCLPITLFSGALPFNYASGAVDWKMKACVPF